MRILTSIAIVAIIQTGCFVLTTAAQEGADTSCINEFRQHAEQWRQAYNSKDSTTLESMYADNAQYIPAHVAGYILHGRDRVIENFQNGARSGGHIDTLEVLSVNSSCDMVTLVTKYVGMAGGNKVNGRNLLVCKRTKGRWIIATHMTVVRD